MATQQQPMADTSTHHQINDGGKNQRNPLNGTHVNGPGQQLWDPSQSYATRTPSRIANPGPLGLFAFASTTFLLSLTIVSARGVSSPNIIVGMALFVGGLALLLAGMWEYPRGHVFGATIFTLYGAFYLSYATILIPASNVLGGYSTARALDNALGLYYITWFVVTFLLFVGSLRKSITFILLLGSWWMSFMLLAISHFIASSRCNSAGGAFGILTAIIAFYAALSEFLVFEESYFMMPLGALSNRHARAGNAGGASYV